MLRWILLLMVVPVVEIAANEVTEQATQDQATQDKVEKKYVIIHADDAGMSHSVNRGTIDAMERGVVSSASIMVPCPWFPEFAKYAREHPEQDYGIHLTLNSEWSLYRWRPVSDPSAVPSLVDDQGFLWSNVEQVAENARLEEVDRELRAQIDRARHFGVPLTHLDTHMGSAFARPDLARLYVQLGQDYDLPVLAVRPTPENGVADAFPEAVRITAALQAAGYPVLDDVFQYYERGDFATRKAKYLQVIRALRPGVTEIIIHCGYNDAELQAITSSVGIRDTDRAVFMDAEVRQALATEGVEVIGWRQFRQLRGVPAVKQE